MDEKKIAFLSRPAVGAALRDIVLEFIRNVQPNRDADEPEWIDILTDDRVTISELLDFVVRL